ncbi:MAG: PP2C family protein-serine/threonine phosphatase [Acidobacteriota bacterium]
MLAQPAAARDPLAAALRADLPSVGIGSALGAIAVGLLLFALLAGRRRHPGLLWAGLFAGIYGVRLVANTALAGEYLGQPGWLAYGRAILEYLAPVPAAALFLHHFGNRWRRLNRLVVVVFTGWAIVAISYDLVRRAPFAAKPVEDVLVILFLAVGLLNLVTGGGERYERLALRLAIAVFILFVANEHFRLVDPGRWPLASEPVGMLILIGTLATIAMQRAVKDAARLVAVDTELTTARGIQRSILPERAPRREGLEVAAVYRPASHVGGDFYDFVELPEGRLGLFIADVAGHGVPAALVASMLKIALAAQRELGAPASVLAELNRLFCGRLKRQFISAAFALADPRRGTLEIASGGHPPLLLAGPSGVREATARGPVLGRFPEAEFRPAIETLAEGDVALLYTDGVVEARNRRGEAWGEERLRDCLAANRQRPAEEIAAAVADAAAAWSTASGGPDDDLTLLVLRATPRP